MTMNKFKIIFYSFIVICVLISVFGFASYDFIETNVAHDMTMKYFSLPILIVMFPTCSIIYLKFLLQHESKKYKTKLWTNLRTAFRILILTLAMTALLYGTTLSLIILTNAELGDSKTITLNARIVDYQTMESSGTVRHYIKIQDPQINRIIKLKVNRPYVVGQTFEKTMEIGHWGLLYSEK